MDDAEVVPIHNTRMCNMTSCEQALFCAFHAMDTFLAMRPRTSDRELGGRLCQALRPYGVQLSIGQSLQADDGVVSLAHTDELVELHLE
jgi:hypothetical protein